MVTLESAKSQGLGGAIVMVAGSGWLTHSNTFTPPISVTDFAGDSISAHAAPAVITCVNSGCSGMLVQRHDAGGRFGVTFELGNQFIARQSGRQRTRLQIRRNEREGVVMR